MRFTVRLYSAAGRALDVVVRASSEARATAAAQRQADREHPGQGYRPSTVLPA